MVIDADGNVVSAVVVRSPYDDLPEMDEAALEKVKATTFFPAESEDATVAVKIRLPVRFSLND